MLVLTRRIGETLLIGKDVSVTVLGVSRQQVRIGIEADRSIPVHREEIYAKIRHPPHGHPPPLDPHPKNE
jgi:carbon storage regulator